MAQDFVRLQASYVGAVATTVAASARKQGFLALGGAALLVMFAALSYLMRKEDPKDVIVLVARYGTPVLFAIAAATWARERLGLASRASRAIDRSQLSADGWFLRGREVGMIDTIGGEPETFRVTETQREHLLRNGRLAG